MANGFLKGTLPAWVAAIGTVAIALIGFFTINPLIENLELRQDNQRLRVAVDQLARQREGAQQELDLTKRQLETETNILQSTRDQLARLDQEVADKGEQVRRKENQLAAVQQSFNELTAMSAEMLRTFGAQQEQQRKLAAINEELRRSNEGLGAENARLAAENARFKADLEGLKADLANAHKELAGTRRGQRAYVVETLVTKVKAQTESAKHRALRVRGSPAAEFFGTAEVIWQEWAFLGGFKSKQLHSWPEGHLIGIAGSSTGREQVEELFGAREFDLLSERERRTLQEDIRKFMDDHAVVFGAPLFLSPEFVAAFAKAQEELWARRRSAKKRERMVLEEGRPERVATDADVAAAETAVEEATARFKNEDKRVTGAVETLHAALDQMVRQLAPAVGGEG